MQARKPSRRLRMTTLRLIQYYSSVPRIWLQLTLHNTWGILNVLDIIWLRPMPGGIIDETHPFCTGLNPETGQTIWNANLLFRTAPRPTGSELYPAPDPDEEIVNKTG